MEKVSVTLDNEMYDEIERRALELDLRTEDFCEVLLMAELISAGVPHLAL